MKTIPFAIFSVILSFVLSGCLGTTGYVDTKLQKVSYQDLRPGTKGAPVSLEFEFHTFGKFNGGATASTRENILEILEKSKIFSSVNRETLNTPSRLKIIINNTGGVSTSSGHVTGLTLGAMGTATTDYYEITATYNDNGKQPVVEEYRHAIHATIGNKRGPEGLTPMTLPEATDTMIEEVVLLFLHDLQKKGIL